MCRDIVTTRIIVVANHAIVVVIVIIVVGREHHSRGVTINIVVVIVVTMAVVTVRVSILVANAAIPATATLVVVHQCAESSGGRHVVVDVRRDLFPVGFVAFVGLTEDIIHFRVPTNRRRLVQQIVQTFGR